MAIEDKYLDEGLNNIQFTITFRNKAQLASFMDEFEIKKQEAPLNEIEYDKLSVKLDKRNKEYNDLKKFWNNFKEYFSGPTISACPPYRGPGGI